MESRSHNHKAQQLIGLVVRNHKLSINQSETQVPLLSKETHFFSIISSKHCCEPYPSPNPNWYLNQIKSKHFLICLDKQRPYSQLLDKLVKMLTGLQFSLLLFRPSILQTTWLYLKRFSFQGVFLSNTQLTVSLNQSRCLV